MNSSWENFKNELRAIPALAQMLAFLGFVCMVVVFAVLSHTPHKVPPFPFWLLISLAAGAAAAAWILLIGYINMDAGRRGMGRILWTFIAVLVPNCLGILLYFLLRKPVLRPCPRCGTNVDPNFQFCSNCGIALTPFCTHCGRAIRVEFSCCPYCGKAVASATPTPPPMPS